MTTPIDPSRCPLCGGANQCAMEIARATGGQPGTCWCAGVDFPAELLARVPADARHQACICAACAASQASLAAASSGRA
ncbi:cysteine-rich CWC family protein [Caenimonas aquaedulcis]|uniref:Cysteine-rich CWC family protein n=1 Tax=Caenimonas aquaedulcis TaxID=2793270 RepID=A0A931H628_9BURK|nr:cysteine-rich CWC family protein [Caenimonas aquaedulcis]MBG9389246.1 cysteine-rich CWC family protein [Caenimonas aquaedulcis]